MFYRRFLFQNFNLEKIYKYVHIMYILYRYIYQILCMMKNYFVVYFFNCKIVNLLLFFLILHLESNKSAG